MGLIEAGFAGRHGRLHLTCPAICRTVANREQTMSSAAKSRQRSGKRQRLEARVTLDQKRLIERAAELRGTTVTEFVVVSAQQAATQTIKEFETLVLRDE